MKATDLRTSRALLARHFPMEELVGAYTQLRPTASDWTQGTCPMPDHEDSTPSFSVNKVSGHYHCFGCKASGCGPAAFKAAMEGRPEAEVREELLQSIGYTLRPRGPEDAPLDLMKKVAERIRGNLYGPAGKSALEYAKQIRGLSEKTLKTFGVGFGLWNDIPRLPDDLFNYKPDPSPENASATSRPAPARAPWDAPGATLEMRQAGAAGLYSHSGRYYFRRRLTIPILDEHGDVISFTGRVLPEDAERKRPDGSLPSKYLNGQDSRWFHKRETLFGLYQARNAMRSKRQVLIAEGQLDVLSLHQAGFVNTVASMGTALSAAQMRKLWDTAPGMEIFLLFDGDDAGQKATLRAVEQALSTIHDGDRMRICYLPDGLDPDEVVRQRGPQALQQVLDAGQPLSQWLIDHCKRLHDRSTPEGLAAFEAHIRDYADRLPRKAQSLSRMLPRMAVAESSSQIMILGMLSALREIVQMPPAPAPDGSPGADLKTLLRDGVMPALNQAGVFNADGWGPQAPAALVRLGNALAALQERKQALDEAQRADPWQALEQSAASKQSPIPVSETLPSPEEVAMTTALPAAPPRPDGPKPLPAEPASVQAPPSPEVPVQEDGAASFAASGGAQYIQEGSSASAQTCRNGQPPHSIVPPAGQRVGRHPWRA